MNGIFNFSHLQLNGKYFSFRGISIHLAVLFILNNGFHLKYGSITIYSINIGDAIEGRVYHDRGDLNNQKGKVINEI